MMATAFLGYNKKQYSPKWYKQQKINNNNNKRFYSTSTTSNNKAQSIIVKQFLVEKNLNCVTSFEDLGLEETKKEINNFSKGKSGIYLILNKRTLDYYIGSASTNKLYSRYYKHLLSLEGSKVVKNALRKYSIDNFSFIVLELFPKQVNKENNKELLDLEDFYLKSLLPNYNILTEAGTSFGYKHTEITRIKMKSNYDDKRRETIGNLNREKKLSKDKTGNLKEKAIGGVPRIFNEKQMLSMQKMSKSIILYNKDNTVYGEYNSIVEASKSLNCNEKTIRRALKTDSKLLKRT